MGEIGVFRLVVADVLGEVDRREETVTVGHLAISFNASELGQEELQVLVN